MRWPPHSPAWKGLQASQAGPRADGQQLPGDCRGHGPKRLGFCGAHDSGSAPPEEQDLTEQHAPGVVATLEAALHLPKGAPGVCTPCSPLTRPAR